MDKRDRESLDDKDGFHVVGEKEEKSESPTEADPGLPQEFKGVDQDIQENMFPSAPADEDGRIL